MAYIDVIKGGNDNRDMVVFSSINLKNTSAVDSHTAIEISLFRGGKGVYTINDIDFEFDNDDIFIIPSNVSHSISKIDNPTHFYNLYFEPRFIRDSSNFFDTNFFGIFRGDSDNYEYKLDRDNLNYNDVLDIYEKILYEYARREDNYQHMVKVHILEMIITIARNFNYNKHEDPMVYQPTIEAIVKAMDYIDDNFCKDISLTDIAEVACLSTTYFGIVFKKLNGITPWDYVLSKRVKCAVDMMQRSPEMKLMEIAENSGFNSTVSLNRAFRKFSGVTPSVSRDIRKIHRIKVDDAEYAETKFCDIYE